MGSCMETRVWRRRSEGRVKPDSLSICASPAGADMESCFSAYPQGVLEPHFSHALLRMPDVSKTSTSIKESRFSSAVWHLRHSSTPDGSARSPEGGGN